MLVPMFILAIGIAGAAAMLRSAFSPVLSWSSDRQDVMLFLRDGGIELYAADLDAPRAMLLGPDEIAWSWFGVSVERSAWGVGRSYQLRYPLWLWLASTLGSATLLVTDSRGRRRMRESSTVKSFCFPVIATGSTARTLASTQLHARG
jgi:hypothetical protein